MVEGEGGSLQAPGWMAWAQPGPPRGLTPGEPQQLGPAGGEGVLAGGQALVPALGVLLALSCPLPGPVPAIELQRRWLAQEEEGGLGPSEAHPDLLPPAGRFTASTPLIYSVLPQSPAHPSSLSHLTRHLL